MRKSATLAGWVAGILLCGLAACAATPPLDDLALDIDPIAFAVAVPQLFWDEDGDGSIYLLDNCSEYNPEQTDADENGIGDVCDAIRPF